MNETADDKSSLPPDKDIVVNKEIIRIRKGKMKAHSTAIIPIDVCPVISTKSPTL
jgi:hypothetical protein